MVAVTECVVCGGRSVSNCGPGPTNGGHGGASDIGRVSRGHNVAYSGRTHHVNTALSGNPAKQWRRPAESMASCPPVHCVGRASPPLMATDSQNRAPRDLSVSGRARMRQTRRGVGVLPKLMSVVGRMTRTEIREGVG